jgi:superfamily II DNA or RNA helicase
VAKLDTLILSTSKSDVIQASGRILRKKPEDREYVPLIVDITDNFSVFPRQFTKRLKYYKKSKFNIIYDKEEKKEDNKSITLKGFVFK